MAGDPTARTTGHEAPHSSALPPLSASAPTPVSPPIYTPVVQPKISPWPWIAVGALAALVIGGGTAYALWPDRSSPSTQSGSSASATVASPSSPASVVLPDAETATSMVALLNDDLVHHKAFTDAYVDLKNHCGPSMPRLADYDSARLARDVATVNHFAALRASYAARAIRIAASASPRAAALARTFAGLQPDLTAAAAVGVAWSNGLTVGPQACTSGTSGPSLVASADVDKRRATWMSDFRAWVPGGDATLGSTRMWFLGSQPETAL